MATYYVDGTRPDDTGDGLSEATAKRTLAAGAALCTAAGDVLNIKASATYSLTTTVPVTNDGSTAGGRITFRGYSTAPGDGGRPLVTSATNGVALFTLNAANYVRFESLRLTHTASSRGHGLVGETASSGRVEVVDCLIDGCLDGINCAGREFNPLVVEDTEIRNCTGHGIAGSSLGQQWAIVGCEIHHNGGDGVSITNTCSATVHGCLIYRNARGFYDTTTSRDNAHEFFNNTVAFNANEQLRFDADTGSVVLLLVNNVLYPGASTTYPLSVPAQPQTETDLLARVVRSNFIRAGSSGLRQGISAGAGDVTLTADPFVDSANDDYSLNDAAGGGALVRGAAFPGAFPRGLTTNHADGGAADHEDPTGGGGAPRVGSSLIAAARAG